MLLLGEYYYFYIDRLGGKVLLGVIINNWGQDYHFLGARFNWGWLLTFGGTIISNIFQVSWGAWLMQGSISNGPTRSQAESAPWNVLCDPLYSETLHNSIFLVDDICDQ